MKHFVSKQQWENRISYKHFWVVDDVVVSTIIYTHYDNNNDAVNISGVYVDVDYRRKGLATMMLKETLDNNIPYSLEVRKDNLSAIKLYEKFSFHYWQESDDKDMIWMKDFKYSKI